MSFRFISRAKKAICDIASLAHVSRSKNQSLSVKGQPPVEANHADEEIPSGALDRISEDEMTGRAYATARHATEIGRR